MPDTTPRTDQVDHSDSDEDLEERPQGPGEDDPEAPGPRLFPQAGGESLRGPLIADLDDDGEPGPPIGDDTRSLGTQS